MTVMLFVSTAESVPVSCGVKTILRKAVTFWRQKLLLAGFRNKEVDNAYCVGKFTSAQEMSDAWGFQCVIWSE
jgi:hypothetical protein